MTRQPSDASEPRSGHRARVPERTLEDLHWATIAGWLEKACHTKVGRRAAAALPFYTDVADIERELDRVDEWRRLEATGDAPSFGGITSLEQALDQAGRTGTLTAQALLAVAETLSSARRMARALERRARRAPRLAELAAGIPDLTPLARMLFATFEPSGRIRDEASPTLANLRRDEASTVARARRIMERYLQTPELELAFQDDYFTLRDHRYVLPVKSGEHPAFRGIVHGYSNSGQTVFLEPEEMVPVNNRLIRLHDEIAREEAAILRDRSERVFEQQDAILHTMAIVGTLDTVQARARLAAHLDAVRPRIAQRGGIHLEHAVNPLLALRGVEVVPNDIDLGDEWQFLVISGPNTGGKTVSLMTTGLCVLMAQAGIPIPAGPNSRIAPFPRVYTLFGDPQDIEADLSTFSGHLRQLDRILREAGPGELVLMDEIIVGTEPEGGAALAVAVLEELAARGAVGAVTTHYERLKTLALRDKRFENASVGLDPRTGRPNYRLTMGVPGRSNPIEMAQRLGLPSRVVERARELLGAERADLEAALVEVERLRARLARREEELETLRRKLESEREKLHQARLDVRRRAADLAQEQAREALDEIAAARKRARELIRALRERKPDMRAAQRARQVVGDLERTVRRRAARAKEDAGAASEKRPKAPPLRRLRRDDLRAGLEVWVRSAGRTGTVVEVPRGAGPVTVALGALRMEVPLSDLALRTDEPAAATPAKPPAAPGAGETPAAPSVEPEPGELPPKTPDNTVDLRGLRVDEGLMRLDAALDRAMRRNAPALYVVHGIGTGALRSAVRDALRESEYVARWEPAPPERGGDGCTIVWLAEE